MKMYYELRYINLIYLFKKIENRNHQYFLIANENKSYL